MAALHPGARVTEPGARRRCALDRRRAPAPVARGRARRVQLWRHGREGRRHARNARRLRRCAAASLRWCRRIRARLLPALPCRLCVRAPLRLPTRCPYPLRLGPRHRWRRSLVALPDDGGSVDGLWRRLSSPLTGPPRACRAGGVCSPCVPCLRAAAQLVVLALRRWDLIDPLVRARGGAGTQPGPFPAVRCLDVARVRPASGRAERRTAPGRGAPCAGRSAPGQSPCSLRCPSRSCAPRTGCTDEP